MVLSQVPRDLAEAFTFARGHVIIGGVLAVTIAMNLLGFCYYALVAPIARQVFMVSPTLTGMLAGAEAFGALLGGLWLTGRRTAPERTHADGGRIAVVPGVRDR